MATNAPPTSHDNERDGAATGVQRSIKTAPAPGANSGEGAPPTTGDQPPGPCSEGGPRPIELAKLQPDQRVDGLLACARKAVVNAPSGLTFLVAVLRDGERKIHARAFERVHELADQFDRGDVVHVRGHVIVYNGEQQIKLERIERHQLTASARFLPVARRDLDELDGFLEHLAREVHDLGYGALLGSLLTDRELRDAWRTAPCSCSGHHAYLGGLLEHTVAVATLALETCALYSRLNADLLLTAAITHDVGLTRAFTYAADIEESDAGRMLGHIEIGLEILRVHARGVRLAQRAWQPLAHCVLAHHGLPAGFGGASFVCAEALALRRLVALDEGVKRSLETGQTVSSRLASDRQP